MRRKIRRIKFVLVAIKRAVQDAYNYPEYWHDATPCPECYSWKYGDFCGFCEEWKSEDRYS